MPRKGKSRAKVVIPSSIARQIAVEPVTSLKRVREDVLNEELELSGKPSEAKKGGHHLPSKSQTSVPPSALPSVSPTPLTPTAEDSPSTSSPSTITASCTTIEAERDTQCDTQRDTQRSPSIETTIEDAHNGAVPTSHQNLIDSTNLAHLTSLLSSPIPSPVPPPVALSLSLSLHHYLNRVPTPSSLKSLRSHPPSCSSPSNVTASNFTAEDYVSSLPISDQTLQAVVKAKEVLTRWRKKLKIGDEVSAHDSQSFESTIKFLPRYFRAKITSLTPSGSSVTDSLGTKTLQLGGFKLTFNGFSRKYDRWYSYDDDLVQPVKGCSEESNASSVPSWICRECNEIEASLDIDAPLLICEGPCLRTFHTVCVGEESVPEGKWICRDCKEERHMCVVCAEYGEDGVEGGVVKCGRKNCGLYFHESCVRNYNFDEDEKWVRANEEAITSKTEPPPLQFTCPAHFCWSCQDVKKEDRKKWGKKDKDLFTCMYCPISYHLSCIPPNANFHELALLCHEHAHLPLPEMNPEASVLKGEDEKKKSKKTKPETKKKSVGTIDVTEFDFNTKYEGFTVPPMVLPMEGGYLSTEQEDAIAFKLPINIQAEVFSKPPKYVQVSGLKYMPGSRPPPNICNDVCTCVPVSEGGNGCDEDCLNRTLYIECFDKNCNIGPECGNRRLSQKQVARTRPEREMGKGWGLVALDDVEPGELVGEYVGEVLTEQQTNERLEEHERLHPNDPNFYLMELEHGFYIDARVKGNLSRFINHSCDPNCQLQRTNVAGDMRIAIVCIRPVKQGEFLCYDYQFDTEHASKFVCACGAEKCRGTMKGGREHAYKEEEKVKNKAEQLKDARAKEERDRNFVAKVQKGAVKRLDQTDLLVPECGGNDELVLSGPLPKYRNFVMDHNVALWRNVKRGYSGLIMKAQEKGM
ncbi:hypothetical protein TrST_g11329 [Triparma strigata]|uniref:Histone-lysine N-methyltransferase n=2 Tax=Triparma strigata TaxID=1606541 RepID=A0A9W7AHZ3_9STRA|nr:hypothetical protein TrST_g11329 [Triparma strigata]